MNGFDAGNEDRARAMPLLALAIALSAFVHLGVMWTFSDCSFAGADLSQFRSERKWSRDVPVMQARRMAGDPLAAEVNARGRPAAAPVVERESDRVDRLVKVEQGADAPRAAIEAHAAKPNEPAAETPKISAPEISPRADVLRIENPVVADDAATLPRRVEEAVPRFSGAPDVSPPGDVFAPAAIASAPVAVPAPAALDVAPAVSLPAAPAGFGFGDGDSDSFGLGVAAAAEAAKKPAVVPPPPEAESPLPPKIESDVVEKVRSQVDEKAVAKTKENVSTLRDRVQGESFEQNVKLDLAQWIDPERPLRKYFRIRISSDSDNPLSVVAKDVIYLLDASGSIADDRLKSCRNAVSEEIRRLNSNDRFNVVAFRDKFSYCFDGWQSVESFTVRKADEWLARLKAHGRTDVFGTLRSLMAVPRAPDRPMIALVVTDGEATSGLTRSAEIISRFSELNGGLVSVYMYGVKDNANAYLMDMLARGNRGGWRRHDGNRWRAASGIPSFAEKFADPVLADVNVRFAEASRCEAYPRLVTNLYRAEPIEIWGACPSDQADVLFEVRGLNGAKVYENVFRLSFDSAAQLDASAIREWSSRKLYALVEDYTREPTPTKLSAMRDFATRHNLQVPYASSLNSTNR